MKRKDFRIIKVEKFDGHRITTTYRVMKRVCFFFWYRYTEQNSWGYAENLIKDHISSHEAYKNRKTTKTIVG